MRMKTVFSTLIIVCLTGQTRADMLFEYDICSNSSSSISASSLAEHVLAGSLAASGVDVLTGYGDGIFTASAWSESSTRDTSRYYQWSASAETGLAIDYESVDLSLTRGHYLSEHGAETWQLCASTDAFASSDILLQTWDISATDFDSVTVLAGQDISVLGTLPGTVTFRLYGFDADHAGQSGDYSGLAYAHPDLTGSGCNLSMYGQSVPEPTTLGFLTIGALAMLRRKRTPHRNNNANQCP